MAARREITTKFACGYARASRAGKGRLLDALVASTGWTRDHAHRAIRADEGGPDGRQVRPGGTPPPRAFALLLGPLCATMLFLYVYWRYRNTD